MKKILNVGCGKDTYGTDFVDMYPNRPEVIQCDTEKGLPYADNTFDEVYSHCNFEHLKNPFSMLVEMKRVAKIGGRVRVITDNGSCWIYAMDNRAHAEGYETEEYPGDRHYSFFTKTHLKSHYAAAGLEVEDVKFVEYFSPTRLKRAACHIVQSFLKLTPFRNMAYARIEIVGIKKAEIV